MIYKKIGEAERLERHLAVLRNKGQDVVRGSFGESDSKSYSDRFVLPKVAEIAGVKLKNG